MRHLFRNYRSSARLVRTTATQPPPPPPPPPGRCNEWKTTFDSGVKGIESRFSRMDSELGGGLESRIQTTMTKAVRTRENLMEAARILKDAENMILEFQARQLAQKTDAEKASLWTFIKVAAKFSPLSLLVAGCSVVADKTAEAKILETVEAKILETVEAKILETVEAKNRGGEAEVKEQRRRS